jgi:hypothetical protein
MVRETGNVVIGFVTAKGVQHQEGIQTLLQVLGQYAREFDTSPVGGGLTSHQSLDSSGLQNGLLR